MSLKVFLSLYLIFAEANVALAIDFFDSKVDFFGKHEVKKKEKAETKEKTKFDWEKYLDPKTTDFFKEGDYVPPEPFMEVVRNPTDENMKMWIKYIETKNEVANAFEKKLSEYMAKSDPSVAARKFAAVKAVSEEKPDVDLGKRFRIRFYFDSNCPHCKKMVGTLNALSQEGIYVEGRQVDSEDIRPLRIMFPVQRASKDELSKQKVTAVPLTLVGDTVKIISYRIQGYKPLGEVKETLQSLATK